MTDYSSTATSRNLPRKWRGLAAAALAMLLVLGLSALAPTANMGDIVIPGEDWHGNVRRSSPAN